MIRVGFVWLPLVVVLALPVSGGIVAAEGNTLLAPRPAVDETKAAVRRITLAKLTGQSSLTLRGTDGSATVTFGARADELIVGAKLRLRYSHSPALIIGQSHLKVLLNEEVVGVVTFGSQGTGQSGTQLIDIDPRFIADFNQLRLQLIGHYAADCEDQLHSALWAEVSGASELELTARPLPIASDLALLPEPFFDRRDLNRLTLPFVFAATPGSEELAAAGVVASWFGHLADWRGARFPAHFDQLPSGHALVFATNAARPAFLAGEPAVEQPTLRIVNSPGGSLSKLLLILGRDSAQLRTAANALVQAHASLSGTHATVRGLVPPPLRAPYDAPNWVRSDRPTRLGELIPDVNVLQALGHSPERVRIPLRVAPDLFTWRNRGAALDLKYRHNAPPMQAGASRLTLSLNDELIRSFELVAAQPSQAAPRLRLPLLEAGFGNEAGSAVLPAIALGRRNELQLSFTFGVPRNGNCRDSFVPNVRGVIDPDSTIDFSGFPHYSAMPHLGMFAVIGFPFTKYADLSQTVVVLPERPSARDAEVMLTLMGRMGESTGYPALRVRATSKPEMAMLRDADLLVIGTASQLDLLAQWRARLPAIVAGPQRWLGPAAVPTADGPDGIPDARPLPVALASSDIEADGAIAALLGFEHPDSPKRSVVVVTASAPDQMSAVLDALDDSGKVRAMYGSAVLIHPNKVQSFQVGPSYTVGSLPPWTLVWLHVSNYPLLLGLLAVTVAVGFGWALARGLRRVAARRLKAAS